MARDYKNAQSAKKKKRERPLGSWVSFLSGLFLGLLVALVIYVWRDQVPAVEDAAIFAPVDDVEYELTDEDVEPYATSERKPKFDFYKILPKVEVKVPDWEIARATDDEQEPLQSGTYMIQVGAFKQHRDADRAKAELALTGIQAKIHRAVINGQDVWYRVHVGPFETAGGLRDMRKKLIASNRDFIVLRIDDE